MPGELPEFVPPMLARSGAPFDSERHLFEIKWDGTRAQARRAEADYALTNRRHAVIPCAVVLLTLQHDR